MKPIKRLPPGYWENQENIDKFLSKIKEKYNLNTPEDWNSISKKLIDSNGGATLFSKYKYSLYDLKCMACPEGKLIFTNPPQPSRYWEKQENIRNFLSKIKEKYNLNTPEDWNSITRNHIQSNGGSSLLSNYKYSMFELKCMACPEGKAIFTNPPQLPRFWDNKENVDNFLLAIKEKHNLNNPEDWNKITTTHIQSNGGSSLFKKYSMFELKCLACPEGKSLFTNTPGYWDNQKNIDHFLLTLKEKYNLKTPEDWNSITATQIQSNGGKTLLSKYSMFELKCMACPEGKSIFNNPKHSSGYWEKQENIDHFLSKIKEKYNLNSPEDWKRISKRQIIKLEGGNGLFSSSLYSEIKIKFENPNQKLQLVPFSKLISGFPQKRASQRWLFLQIQKLFPREEIVEDYFHSEISRQSGITVQFDIFMINKNIAIEYHGQQHYEDIPQLFSNVETYKNRDIEKEKICSEHGIQLIVIPYWWDNKLDSLRSFLYSKINL